MGEWLRYIVYHRHIQLLEMVTTLYSGIHYESTGYEGFNWKHSTEQSPMHEVH